MSGLMIVLSAIGGIVVLGMGSCFVCVGMAGHAANKAVTEAEKAEKTNTPSGAATAGATTPTPTAPAETATPVQIGTLLSEYKDNEVRADGKFKGMLIQVTGKVGNIKKGLMGGMYVIVGTGKTFEHPSVQCDLNQDNAAAAANLSKGQTVTVEGRVNGLMGNVFVKDCDIVR
jgi:hypothetical protein